jgi:hypothetical protein
MWTGRGKSSRKIQVCIGDLDGSGVVDRSRLPLFRRFDSVFTGKESTIEPGHYFEDRILVYGKVLNPKFNY